MDWNIVPRRKKGERLSKRNVEYLSHISFSSSFLKGFVESGTINFPDLDKNYEYTYKKLQENINLRSLLTLSLNAHNVVENDTFKKYLEYYGSPLYTDEIISAAFDGQSFENNRGDMNFEVFGNTGSKGMIFESISISSDWRLVS